MDYKELEAQQQALTFSNPRTSARFEDWPSGSRRVTCTFDIETNKKGDKQRCSRVTTGKPKRSTYYNKLRIVDGSDGRTYMLGESGYGHVTVLMSNMQHTFAKSERNPGYEEVKALLAEAA